MSELKKLLNKLDEDEYLNHPDCYLEQDNFPIPITSLIIPTSYDGAIMIIGATDGSYDLIKLGFFKYLVKENGSTFTGSFLVKGAEKAYRILKNVSTIKDGNELFNYLNDLKNETSEE